MRVHLVNPSDISFGTAVITPRWLYVLAGATPASYGDPVITDETLEPFDPTLLQPGDVVGIGIHTSNALRGYQIGREVRDRGAFAVFGGIHATLYPAEASERGAAHAVVKGDGDLVWASVLADCLRGSPQPCTKAVKSRRARSCRPMGPLAAQPVHVGIGADGPRLSEALLVLLGVADRWPEAASANDRRRPARRSSSSDVWASASLRWLTTTSIP